MKKALLLTGIPGSGKSTLVKKLLTQGEYNIGEPRKMLKMMRGKYDIVGDYTDPAQIFPGTDRLSMAVSVPFKEWIVEDSPEKVVIEGDRLVGSNTIDFLIDNGYDILLIALDVDEDIVNERYIKRGSNQDPKFLKSKHTKVRNLKNRLDLVMDDKLVFMDNNLPEDGLKIVETINTFLE